jgi:hypothetical protein
MVLKQNFEWFGNTDPFVSPESMGLGGHRKLG